MSARYVESSEKQMLLREENVVARNDAIVVPEFWEYLCRWWKTSPPAKGRS